MQGITIFGPGRLGGALAVALSSRGYSIVDLIYRSTRPVSLARKLDPRPAIRSSSRIGTLSSPVVIIATQDEDIPEAVRLLTKSATAHPVVFHTSGSLSSSVLEPLKKIGCPVASLHPLASISSAELGAERFRGAHFCLEGDEKAVRVGKRIVRALRGHSFTIEPEAKPLYHAAALLAGGHTTALFDVSLGLMTRAGLSRSQARNVLQPLILSVAENLSEQDTPKALTGTFARGDLGTLDRHLDALRSAAHQSEVRIYIELALRSIDLAERNGLRPDVSKEMRRRLLLAKREGQ
jgi:predicted short-subunit dehydrogenase-like oxidoreductase (DUF2520 family)